MTRARPRIQSVPAAHPYVRHALTPPTGPALIDLPADPAVPGAGRDQWWPSPVLSTAWVEQTDVDAVHVHFGFEHLSAAEVQTWCAALAARHRPLVLTVHDLANPHLADQSGHQAALGVLVAHAAVVLTLTPGAAEEIQRRWNVTAEVLPHPHVAPLDLLGRVWPRASSRRVLLPLGAVRANIDLDLIRRVRQALDSSVDLVIDVRPGRRALWSAAVPTGEPGVQVVEREAGDDAEFAARVAGFDAVLLPYRWGTHSGWVELAHDVGTSVVAPRVGYWHQQQPVHGFDPDPQHQDDLAAALAAALADRPSPADRSVRLAQRQSLADRHLALYRSLRVSEPAR